MPADGSSVQCYIFQGGISLFNFFRCAIHSARQSCQVNKQFPNHLCFTDLTRHFQCNPMKEEFTGSFNFFFYQSAVNSKCPSLFALSLYNLRASHKCPMFLMHHLLGECHFISLQLHLQFFQFYLDLQFFSLKLRKWL